MILQLLFSWKWFFFSGCRCLELVTKHTTYNSCRQVWASACNINKEHRQDQFVNQILMEFSFFTWFVYFEFRTRYRNLEQHNYIFGRRETSLLLCYVHIRYTYHVLWTIKWLKKKKDRTTRSRHRMKIYFNHSADQNSKNLKYIVSKRAICH